MENNKLPTYWYTDNCIEALAYLSDKYGKDITDWYCYTYVGFTGCRLNKGIHGFAIVQDVPNNPVYLSNEEFKEILAVESLVDHYSIF